MRFIFATATAVGSISLAIIVSSQIFAAAIAKTAVPQPISIIFFGETPSAIKSFNTNRQPFVVPWCPVPNAIEASISRPMEDFGTLCASWLPNTKNLPASTGGKFLCTCETQSWSGTSEKVNGFAP